MRETAFRVVYYQCILFLLFINSAVSIGKSCNDVSIFPYDKPLLMKISFY